MHIGLIILAPLKDGLMNLFIATRVHRVGNFPGSHLHDGRLRKPNLHECSRQLKSLNFTICRNLVHHIGVAVWISLAMTGIRAGSIQTHRKTRKKNRPDVNGPV
jgi:hypothetical protein